jgi:hypothetical protein
VLIASAKGLHVKRNGIPVFAPGGRSDGLRGRAVSRSDMAVLVAVAVTLVPALLLAGGALSLPYLLGRGIESLIPGLSDGNSRGQPRAPARSSSAAVPAERAWRFGASTVHAPINRGAGHSTLSAGSDTSPAPMSSRGARAAVVKDPGVTGASPPTGASPSTGGSSAPGTAGPRDGNGDRGTGNPGPADDGGPGISVGANGTTATASAGIGPAAASATASVGANGATTTLSAGTQSTSVSGTATVSGPTPGVSAEVTVADTAAGAGVDVAIAPGETPVAATVASVAASLPAAETTVGSIATGLALPGA